jgi:hypothetical protein
MTMTTKFSLSLKNALQDLQDWGVIPTGKTWKHILSNGYVDICDCEEYGWVKKSENNYVVELLQEQTYELTDKGMSALNKLGGCV